MDAKKKKNTFDLLKVTNSQEAWSDGMFTFSMSFDSIKGRYTSKKIKIK